MPKTTSQRTTKTSEEVESSEPGTLVKVKGIQCLYRYSTKGTYYALIKHQGKQSRKSLKTTDLTEAKRMLRDAQTDAGTCIGGGSSSAGTLFVINTDGSPFSVPHLFSNSTSNGASPESGPTFANGNMYGTTTSGGANGGGAVYYANADGTGVSLLHSFSTNDPMGNWPYAGVTSGSFGATSLGGSGSNGVVFSLNFNSFTALHSFTRYDGCEMLRERSQIQQN